MAVTKTINIDVDTKKAVKGLTDLKHEVSDLINETNELNETNQLFKKELAELEQQFNKIPKSAMSARQAMGAEMDNLKNSIKENNLALRDFRIKKQQKEKMISDLNTVHSKVLHTTEGFAKFGSVIGGAAVGMLKMAGVSEETTDALEGTIHGVESVEHATEGATKAQKLYQTQVKGSGIATKAAALAQKAYALAVGTGSKAMKIFRLALISTGIGAIVVLVGLLIANFDKLLGVFAPVIDGLYAIGDAIGITNKATKDSIAVIDKEVAALKNKEIQIQKNLKQEAKYGEDKIKNLEIDKKLAISLEEKLQIEKDIFDEKAKLIEGEKDNFLSAERIKLAEYEGSLKKNKALRADERDDIFVDAAKINNLNALISDQFIINENLKEQIGNKNYEKFTELDIKKRALEVEYNKTVEKLNEESVKAVEDNNAKKIAAYKQYAGERIAAARRIEDIENELLKEGETKEITILETRFKRLKKDVIGNAKEKKRLRALLQEQEEQAIQDVKDKYQKIADDKQRVIDDKEEAEAIALSDKLAEIKEANAALFRTGQENELLEVEKKYDLLEAMAQGNAEALEDINIARLNAENDINLQYANQAAADQKALDDKTLAEKQELQALILQGAKDTFTTISNLAQLFAGESEESQRKAFKIQKAANIANATIDTYASAVAAFRSLSGVPIVGVPLGIAAAAAAVTAGMLNIKSIGQQEFGGGGGAEPDVPSFDAGAAQAPNFNVVGDSGINQLASLQQQPVQAYVVSGEVTTSQALDRNRVENATL
jgi:hypothetical protein